MEDIKSKNDIEFLIKKFYNALLQIDEMKPPFEGLNFEKHIPNIVQFWSFVLLEEEGYKTNVFDKHLHLPIHLPMFDIWLEVWTRTVSENFKGEKADLAIQRAQVLTYTFKAKWEKINSK
ncbi:MAG: group III truncated hemoglobin [Sphingobacteriaceae bacterium]|nr:group III truncated hemoglobin [Sphingobacteriaceae bacterium]